MFTIFSLLMQMDEMKKENVELRNTIQHRQDTYSETDSAPEVKPRPTSLYNIAQQYINSSNSSIVSYKYVSFFSTRLISTIYHLLCVRIELIRPTLKKCFVKRIRLPKDFKNCQKLFAQSNITGRLHLVLKMFV